MRRDHELAAISRITAILSGLTPGARERVLAYVTARAGSLNAAPPPAPPLATNGPDLWETRVAGAAGWTTPEEQP